MNLSFIHPLEKPLAAVLAVAAVTGGVLTYMAFASLLPFIHNPDHIAWLLGFDVTMVGLLGVVIARQVWGLYRGRAGQAGTSRLHIRVVSLFSVLATLPAIILVLFSVFLFHMGLQSWFSHQVRTAVTEAQAVAQAYLDEHRQTIRADLLGAANDIQRQVNLIYADPGDLDKFLSTQSFLRNFDEAAMFDGSGRVIGRGGAGLRFDPSNLPPGTLQTADAGDPVVFTTDDDSKNIQAVVRVPGFGQSYLYVNRSVDARVLSYLQAAQDASSNYTALEAKRADLQVQFFTLYVVVALLLLMLAVWAGLYLAGQLVQPIDALIDAADQVRGGNLQTRLSEGQGLDEFKALARTFNRMTEELDVQRRELQAAERKAAWADVARRVAHEIKNPLTPIQLSAERLRRKFLKNIPDADQAVYTQCIDTIVRHVGDIGRMVSEFASFARMPDPVLVVDDVAPLIRDIAVMHRGNAGVVKVELGGLLTDGNAVMCAMVDAGQMRQAMTNLVLNAIDSVNERLSLQREPSGHVMITAMEQDDRYIISVMDNGMGFPTSVPLDRLGEPYVTFKEKGSGLGLAIVKKIAHDHKGALRLNGPEGIRELTGWGEGGAVVSILLPVAHACPVALPLDPQAQVGDNERHAA